LAPTKKSNAVPVAVQTSSTSPSIAPRGLRTEQAALYSGLSPFYIEELIRNGSLPAIGGPGTGIAAYVVLREHLDDFLTDLGEGAEERAVQRRKSRAAAATVCR
jgi:hypothetical protein